MQKSRLLYPFLALYSVGVVIAGFGPAYFFPLVSQTKSYSWLIHFHALVFTSWLLFFCLQTTLIYKRRIPKHKKFGNGLAYFALILVFTGLSATIVQSRYYESIGQQEQALFLLFTGHRDMIIFSMLFSLALYFKNKPAIHAKYMLGAHTMLLVAAVARIHQYLQPNFPFSFIIIWLSPLLIAFIASIAKKDRTAWQFIPIFLLLFFGSNIIGLAFTGEQLMSFWSFVLGSVPIVTPSLPTP